jgi:hypothetical protein
MVSTVEKALQRDAIIINIIVIMVMNTSTISRTTNTMVVVVVVVVAVLVQFHINTVVEDDFQHQNKTGMDVGFLLFACRVLVS